MSYKRDIAGEKFNTFADWQQLSDDGDLEASREAFRRFVHQYCEFSLTSLNSVIDQAQTTHDIYSIVLYILNRGREILNFKQDSDLPEIEDIGIVTPQQRITEDLLDF